MAPWYRLHAYYIKMTQIKPVLEGPITKFIDFVAQGVRIGTSTKGGPDTPQLLRMGSGMAQDGRGGRAL